MALLFVRLRPCPGIPHLRIVYPNLLVSVQRMYLKIDTIDEKLYHLRFFTYFLRFIAHFSFLFFYVSAILAHIYSHLIVIDSRQMGIQLMLSS